MNLLRRREDLVCRQVVELVSDYLGQPNLLQVSGAVGAARQVALEPLPFGPGKDILEVVADQLHHLAGCPHCTAYLEQIRLTVATIGRLTPDDFSPEVSQKFTELYRAWRVEGSAAADESG
jgi:hypothetical protein